MGCISVSRKMTLLISSHTNIAVVGKTHHPAALQPGIRLSGERLRRTKGPLDPEILACLPWGWHHFSFKAPQSLNMEPGLRTAAAGIFVPAVLILAHGAGIPCPCWGSCASPEQGDCGGKGPSKPPPPIDLPLRRQQPHL